MGAAWSQVALGTMTSVWPDLEELLPRVQKPARYIGLEGGHQEPVHAPHKVAWLLGYPDTYEVGLPKGRLEEGESILEAAQREMKEEIGYGARELTELTELSLAPGYMTHITHIVLARDLYPEKLEGDEPEENPEPPATRKTQEPPGQDHGEGETDRYQDGVHRCDMA